jgi:hypothetical protein
VTFTNEGRVAVSDTHAYSGTYSLQLDDARDDSIESMAAAILAVDLAGQSDVMLDFWWREFLDESDEEDGVFISDDGGATWQCILAFDGGGLWQRQVVDLDAAAAAHGLALNDLLLIKFQFYDDDPIPSDGYAIDEVRLRPNAAPALSWPGGLNYEEDGLHPESGGIEDDYTYRVRYADPEGDPPGLVEVHIEKGGLGIAGSPFAMTCAGGDYSTGVLCSITKQGLEAGLDYTYHFAARDDQGNEAPLTPELNGPDVTITYRVYLPTLLRNVGPPAGPPVLYAIDNAGGSYAFTVRWSAVERATSYRLEQDSDEQFPSPSLVYQGPDTSTPVTVDAVGTYYYRVRASSSLGTTDWSHVQSVAVTVPPPEGWRIKTVDSADGSIDLALDGDGNPHISYDNDGLWRATPLGNDWDRDSIDDYAYHTSIAIDDQGFAHILYFRSNSRDDTLKLADEDSEGWHPASFNLGGLDVGRYNDLAVDANDDRHLLFSSWRCRLWGGSGNCISWDPGDLYYLFLHDGQFQASIVGYSAEYVSVALDDDDAPHVSYHNGYHDTLKYSRPGFGGAHTVDESADVGLYSSIAVDSRGALPLPHIAYYDVTQGDLKYATATGPDFYHLAWHTEPIDTVGDVYTWDVTKYTSIVLDRDGYPQISYYDDDTQDLKYAYQDNQGWHKETVDSDGDVGSWSSLAIDQSGNLHVAYYDATNGTVKYGYLVRPD